MPGTLRTFVPLGLVVAVLACGSDGGVTAPPAPPPPPPPNAPPVVSAGADQDVSLEAQVTLHGSATDPEGQTLTFTWTQISGPAVGSLAGATPTFRAPEEVVTLEFDVVAFDGRDASAPDRVVIWVLENAEAGGLWVAPTGDDAQAGTRAAPKRTIQAAINASTSAADIYVAAGTYTQTATLTLRVGVSIYGGFHATSFLRNAATNETVIAGATTAISGSSANGVKLDGLTITSANGTAASRTSTVIALSNSDNVVISRNRLTAGNGAPGAQGLGPEVLPIPGVDGNSASGSSPGGGGTGGGFGGGAGGVGGADADFFCTSDGTSGASGGGPRGGAGGAGSASDGNGAAGSNGGPGNNGADGGSGPSFGALSAGAYIPANGTSGTSGAAGSGGGGGGGGDCVVTGFLIAYLGGGGGGGGSGGVGRAGSGGGSGGGGSFGILVTNGSTGVLIRDNVITTGNGGGGGGGANAHSGGGGGIGGAGADPEGGGGLGGRGGNGGSGGWGGTGAGGGGGPTIGVVEDFSSSTNLFFGNLAGSTITMGAPGNGGAGGLKPNLEGNAPSGADGLRKEYEKRPPPPLPPAVGSIP